MESEPSFTGHEREQDGCLREQAGAGMKN